MTNFTMADLGFSAGSLLYGAGIMVINVNQNKIKPNASDEHGIIVGHGGDTYGFLSQHGFAPSLNASISMIQNVDFDPSVNILYCQAMQIVFKYQGIEQDLACQPIKKAKFGCLIQDNPPQPMCRYRPDGIPLPGKSWHDCKAACDE